MAQNLYECSVRSSSVAAAGTYNIVFTTGPTHCVFLDRLVGFSGVAAEADVYRAPVYSGGTIAPFFAIDTSTGTPSSSVFTIDATVSGLGTKVGATSYYRGSTSVGNGIVGTYGSQQGKRRLSPYTTYLLQFKNTDINPQVIDVYFRWYEGPQESPGGV